MDAIGSIGGVSTEAQSVLREIDGAAGSTRFDELTPDAVAEMSDRKKQELAKDFEGVLLTRLFNEVKESLQAASFDDDAGADQVHSMFWSFLAEDVADKGGFGLWQDLYRQFKDMEGTGASGELINKEV